MYQSLNKPKNSIELHKEIAFSDNYDEVKKLMVDGYESNFDQADYEFISDVEKAPNRIRQLTLLEYDEKTYLLSTTPGTKRVEVFDLEELPDDIENYLLQLEPQ